MKNFDQIKKYFEDNKDKVFRYVIYKRMFTPYEQDKKFSDASIYEDDFFTHCKIKNVLPLGEDDFILEAERVFSDDEEYDPETCTWTEFVKFSEIRLSCFDRDNRPQNDDDKASTAYYQIDDDGNVNETTKDEWGET